MWGKVILKIIFEVFLWDPQRTYQTIRPRPSHFTIIDYENSMGFFAETSETPQVHLRIWSNPITEIGVKQRKFVGKLQKNEKWKLQYCEKNRERFARKIKFHPNWLSISFSRHGDGLKHARRRVREKFKIERDFRFPVGIVVVAANCSILSSVDVSTCRYCADDAVRADTNTLHML